jgi:PTH1 family peptidyl-tRNA hydrolase
VVGRLWDTLKSSARRSGGDGGIGRGSTPQLIIVGLGNPGSDYRNTRHNAGAWCLDELARRCGVKLKRIDTRVSAVETILADRNVVLAMPRTYMNQSGQAVGHLLRRYAAGPDRLVVLVDDMDLEPGKIRIRAQGSAGGHNGLKSIVGTIGSTEFCRIRIGVGRPGARGKEIDHVLSPLSREDRGLVDEAVKRAADSIEAIAVRGIQVAMNEFN